MNNTRRADSLRAGDRFIYRDVMVTVLRDAEPYSGKDMATFAFWCSRADTGAEGWVPFGPNGVVEEAGQA